MTRYLNSVLTGFVLACALAGEAHAHGGGWPRPIMSYSHFGYHAPVFHRHSYHFLPPRQFGGYFGYLPDSYRSYAPPPGGYYRRHRHYYDRHPQGHPFFPGGLSFHFRYRY